MIINLGSTIYLVLINQYLLSQPRPLLQTPRCSQHLFTAKSSVFLYLNLPQLPARSPSQEQDTALWGFLGRDTTSKLKINHLLN